MNNKKVYIVVVLSILLCTISYLVYNRLYTEGIMKDNIKKEVIEEVHPSVASPEI